MRVAVCHMYIHDMLCLICVLVLVGLICICIVVGPPFVDLICICVVVGPPFVGSSFVLVMVSPIIVRVFVLFLCHVLSYLCTCRGAS